MGDKYRTFELEKYGDSTQVAVYANHNSDAVVYICAASFCCGLHMTPDEARHMACLLNLAADEAMPAQISEAA